MMMAVIEKSFRIVRCTCRTSGFAIAAMASTTMGCRGEASATTDGADRVMVAYIAPDSATAASALLGARLGAEEAERTGALLGRTFVVQTAYGSTSAEAVRAAERLLDDGAFAIVGGFDDETCAALGDLAAARGVIHMNVGCRADHLRGAATSANTFHVEASDSMYLSAIGAMRSAGGAAPVLWHGGLARYGAAQLNRRFLERFGQPADASAWASWMAMKVLWQASFDTKTADPAELRARLADARTEFDGHKGEPLRFDVATRQLRQPLFPPYVAPASADREAGERILETASESERAALRRAVMAGEPLLIVTNEGSSDVTILQAAREQPLATIRFAERPRGLQLDREGRHGWVALSDERPTEEGDGDAIAVIDLREGRVIARHAAGSDPEQFAVSHDGAVLVAANEDAGTATLTDMRRGTVLATLIVGIEPEGVAMSPDGRWAYVTAETSNTISVIDVPARDVTASFLVGERPRAAVFAPDGHRAYVTNEISGTLTVVDVARHAVIATVELAEGRAKPVGVVVSPDNRTVYIANGHANSVSVVDAGTLRETQVIPVGRRPWGLALSRDGTTLYAANGLSNDVSVIDTRTGRVTSTIAVGERPWGVAVTR